MGQPGFFDVDERLAALSATGDPLERLSVAVDAALARSDRSWGGRPPYDEVLMFKVPVLQDDVAECQPHACDLRQSFRL